MGEHLFGEGPPVLMLHTAGLSAAEWYANYNALGTTYHLFGLDMIGDAGKSVLQKSPDQIEDYQLSILQILDSLQLGKVILVGQSTSLHHRSNCTNYR